jgi:hypothetical protein
MAGSFFNLTLDLTGPASPSLSLMSGATYATQELIDAGISTADGTTTNYQMKIWGELDLTWAKANGIVGASATTTLEADALWIAYSTSKQVQLKALTGTAAENRTIYLKIRDDVYNVSAQASDSILLDTSIPTVSITGPDVSKISEQSGKNVCSFSFQVDQDFVEYKIKVVSSTGADNTTGVTIPISVTPPIGERSSVSTDATATDLSDTGTFTANQVINVKINGTDLKTASAGDGSKIIKVFVKDSTNHWSA